MLDLDLYLAAGVIERVAHELDLISLALLNRELAKGGLVVIGLAQMVQDTVIAHCHGWLDAQAIHNRTYAARRREALQHKPLDGDIVDLRLDRRGTVHVNLEHHRLEVGSDPLLAADCGKGFLTQIGGLDIALSSFLSQEADQCRT